MSDHISHGKIAASYRWLRFIFLISAILLAALHTWAASTSYSMSEDGISYLDMGDAYLRGDWEMAINSVWSPMYAWILGLALTVLNPPMQWEFPFVHLVNFAIYLGALICFEFFWRHLTLYKGTKVASSPGGTHMGLPEWAWMSLGYTLFIWASLSLIRIWTVTPDLLMAAFVYLAAGLILRIRSSQDHWITFGLLGMVLGLGYLTKSVMFPLAFVFLAISFFSMVNLRQALPRVMVALLVFLLFSAPYIAAISLTKNRLTFGDAGTLTYVRYVNNVPYPHWQGKPAESGIPKHPSRQIYDKPPIYEFGSPIAGTYPISYDPSFWYEGVVPRVNVSQQIALLLASAIFYFDLFLHQQGALVFSVTILFVLGTSRQDGLASKLRRWGLALVALAALGMYSLVYVEGRYIAAFLVLLWGDLLANLNLPESWGSKRLVSALSGVMVLFMLMNVLFFNLEGVRDLTGRGSAPQPGVSQSQAPSWPGEVAEKLHTLGIRPGDKVAIIGYGFGASWARLARVQIVAEMLSRQAEDFWLGDASLQSDALQAFAGTGARAVVAENVPRFATLSGWHRVGQSNYYIYILSE